MKKYLFMAMSIFLLFGCADKQEPESSLEKSQAKPINFEAESQKLQQGMAASLKEHATPEDMQTMSQFAENLASSMPSPGLAVGTQAPDFTLVNAFGKAITLSQELKKGPVVLVFYRGSWCPFCNLHLHALQSIIPELKSHNTQLIAITPQKPDESAKELKDKGYPFEVLSDLDYSVAKAYNLYFDMSPELLAVYAKFGIDLESYNGEGRTALPVPGTLVIDEEGTIQAIHAETDYKQRMEPAEVLAVIERI